MTQNLINGQLAILEYHLFAQFRPVFLVISGPNDDIIQILIACTHFKTKHVGTRVHAVFNLIKEKCPDILSEYLFVVQAYDSDEMDQILEDTFNGT